MSRTKINNEKIYKDYDIISYTANTNREFYVTDKIQLEKDGNLIKQEVHQYSDLYPIPGTDKIITDNDRIEIEKRAYTRAIRKLKSQRPEQVYQFDITSLPNTVNVGDKVRFIFDKYETSQDECGEKIENHIVHIDDYFYITKIRYTFDENLNEINTITLDKELRPNDFDMPELELADKPKDTGSSGSSSGSNLYDNDKPVWSVWDDKFIG